VNKETKSHLLEIINAIDEKYEIFSQDMEFEGTDDHAMWSEIGACIEDLRETIQQEDVNASQKNI
jgi:hypothetical protein